MPMTTGFGGFAVKAVNGIIVDEESLAIGAEAPTILKVVGLNLARVRISASGSVCDWARLSRASRSARLFGPIRLTHDATRARLIQYNQGRITGQVAHYVSSKCAAVKINTATGSEADGLVIVFPAKVTSSAAAGRLTPSMPAWRGQRSRSCGK